MKKTISILIILILLGVGLFILTGCGENTELQEENTGVEENQVADKSEETSAPEEFKNAYAMTKNKRLAILTAPDESLNTFEGHEFVITTGNDNAISIGYTKIGYLATPSYVQASITRMSLEELKQMWERSPEKYVDLKEYEFEGKEITEITNVITSTVKSTMYYAEFDGVLIELSKKADEGKEELVENLYKHVFNNIKAIKEVN